ncbi:LptF/LptG family permease [Chrysiogenes arsenatis]|uniref:LptF/LptG family permease n=1 Tax=Chrysiogenes arsenatis TaxID=309797 RepID=UPI000409428A|nr:LptF/LptG family permease [Chrysiogenes arsenatis]
MKIYQRYVLREFALFFLAAFVSLAIILTLNSVLKLSSELLGKGISLFDILAILLYTFPQTIFIALPIAALIGAAAMAGVLGRNNELTVLMASGISRMQLMAVVGAVAGGLAIFGIVNNHYLIPQGAERMGRTVNAAVANLSYESLTPGVFRSVGDAVLYCSRVDREGLHDILVATPSVTISARLGQLVRTPQGTSLLLFDGSVLDSRQGTDYIRFSRHEFPLRIEGIGLNRSHHTITSVELRQREDSGAVLQFHKRTTFALATLFFGVLGFLIGTPRMRSAKSSGVLVGIGVVVIFHLLRSLSTSLAKGGTLPLWCGEWVPLIVLAGVTVGTGILAARR